MDRYFNTVTKVEEFGPGPNIVVLPPENVFWSPLPTDHELVFDMAGIPTGTQPIPPPAPGTADAIRAELELLNINSRTVTRAMYLDHLGFSGLLATIDASIATVALNNSTTTDVVVSFL